MTQEKIRERAKELYKENCDRHDLPGPDYIAKENAIDALTIMGEWAAGISDPDAPTVERVEGGYKITYNGITYQAKHGLISADMSETKQPVKLIEELTSLINRRSLENHSNTPDYVLATFLLQCLHSYGEAVKSRDRFHNSTNCEKFKPGGVTVWEGAAGEFLDEDGPECIITPRHILQTPPDLSDQTTFNNIF